MVQELLPLLPQVLTSNQTVAAIACIAAGAVLWLMGAAWSRAIVILIAVAAGALTGELLPRWYPIAFSSMALAVFGAVLFGMIAAVLPRLWVGLVLGIVLCAWTTFGLWTLLRGDNFVWQTRQDWEVQNMTVPERVQDYYLRLPDPMRRVMPYAIATALISALCTTLLWPRIGRVLMCSCLGLTLMVPAALTLVSIRFPDWLSHIPPDPRVQYSIIGGLVVLGALIEWQLLPGKKAAPPPKEEPKEAVPHEPTGRYSWRG